MALSGELYYSPEQKLILGRDHAEVIAQCELKFPVRMEATSISLKLGKVLSVPFAGLFRLSLCGVFQAWQYFEGSSLQNQVLTWSFIS